MEKWRGCCDWMPEQARWQNLAHEDYALSLHKLVNPRHVIIPFLFKLV